MTSWRCRVSQCSHAIQASGSPGRGCATGAALASGVSPAARHDGGSGKGSFTVYSSIVGLKVGRQRCRRMRRRTDSGAGDYTYTVECIAECGLPHFDARSQANIPPIGTLDIAWRDGGTGLADVEGHIPNLKGAFHDVSPCIFSSHRVGVGGRYRSGVCPNGGSPIQQHGWQQHVSGGWYRHRHNCNGHGGYRCQRQFGQRRSGCHPQPQRHRQARAGRQYALGFERWLWRQCQRFNRQCNRRRLGWSGCRRTRHGRVDGGAGRR
jgi:hypothetical protein